jgi:hypothetical protein
MEAFYLLLLIGVLTVGFGVHWTYVRMRFAKTALMAHGRVVDIKYGMMTSGFLGAIGSTGTRDRYQAVIEFTTKKGELISFRPPASGIEPNLDERVEVLYNPENPSEAVEIDLVPVTFAPIVMTTIGAAIALGSLYLVFNPPQSTEQPATRAGLNQFGKRP